jgi:hypothetical protein
MKLTSHCVGNGDDLARDHVIPADDGWHFTRRAKASLMGLFNR